MRPVDLLRKPEVDINTIDFLHYVCNLNEKLTRVFMQVELGTQYGGWEAPHERFPEGYDHSIILPLYQQVQKTISCGKKRTDKRIGDIILDAILQEGYDDTILKRIQMSVGEAWQEVIGGMPDWQNLGQGHATGLDICYKNMLYGEIKNRTNTDNSSSKKENMRKLQLHKQNTGAKVFYGYINGTKHESYVKDGVEFYVGDDLLNMVFGSYKVLFKDLLRTLIYEAVKGKTALLIPIDELRKKSECDVKPRRSIKKVK